MKDRMHGQRFPFPWRGLVQHLSISLRLNFRSPAPLVYGYAVPVFFLLAFGSVFRTGSPPLLREMGQLLAITILGGACFGLPTTLVAERDRGVWRRYRLLPASARALVLSASVGRALLVGSAAALQLALAWSLYRTPLPALPGQFLAAFACVCFAFLGMGLVIAMLAPSVPAVQAIGQCVFLPMILVGGVGVPLRALPVWTQQLAGFLPGRYAVEALDACIRPGGGGLAAVPFALGALVAVGAAGYVAGFGLFRWDPGARRLNRAAKGWIALALAAWLVVGGLAWLRGHAPANAPVSARREAADAPWRHLTERDLAAIRYDDLPPDDGIFAPVDPQRRPAHRRTDPAEIARRSVKPLEPRARRTHRTEGPESPGRLHGCRSQRGRAGGRNCRGGFRRSTRGGRSTGFDTGSGMDCRSPRRRQFGTGPRAPGH